MTTVHVGTHYSVVKIEGDARDFLKAMFPEGDSPDEMNFVLFSTSGVHGSYSTIEEIEATLDSDDDYHGLTVLIVHPRLVCLKYGTLIVRRGDLPWLKALRAKSHSVTQAIGS